MTGFTGTSVQLMAAPYDSQCCLFFALVTALTRSNMCGLYRGCCLFSAHQVDPTKVTDMASFKDDLGLDSLDAVEVVMAIEDEFTIEIPDSEADKILTVADAISFIITHPSAK